MRSALLALGVLTGGSRATTPHRWEEAASQLQDAACLVKVVHQRESVESHAKCARRGLLSHWICIRFDSVEGTDETPG
jgi:hypothetical protein